MKPQWRFHEVSRASWGLCKAPDGFSGFAKLLKLWWNSKIPPELHGGFGKASRSPKEPYKFVTYIINKYTAVLDIK